MATRQIVDDDDVDALGKKCAYDVRSDVTGSSCDKPSHLTILCFSRRPRAAEYIQATGTDAHGRMKKCEKAGERLIPDRRKKNLSGTRKGERALVGRDEDRFAALQHDG
ncbi:hypothetical protein GCM10027056_25160 [Glaciibacter psychrotolerans]